VHDTDGLEYVALRVGINAAGCTRTLLARATCITYLIRAKVLY